MQLEEIKKQLLAEVQDSDDPRAVLRSPELKSLYKQIPNLPPESRSSAGQKINELKRELERAIEEKELAAENTAVEPLDITAPFDVNAKTKPQLLAAGSGSLHPLMVEMQRMREIAEKIGFNVIEGRQLDDEAHMFDFLNFPADHPARDNYDTFRTEEGFVPPAHTTAMQMRILKSGRAELEKTGQIATVTLGRTFRNEDVDATHEHTFHQWDGVFISKTATLAQMIAVIREFFNTFYGEKLKIGTQPANFPFTEPGMEFLIEKPASIGGKKGDWLEMLGCGMVHPNVLKMADIDPKIYKGFAWGGGFDRLVMLKYGIDDVRYFESGKLKFLKEFSAL